MYSTPLGLPKATACCWGLMPSPTPAFVASLIKRLGEDGAIEYLGRWSNAILNGEKPPAVPRSKRVQQ